jgi:hypothetical protein
MAHTDIEDNYLCEKLASCWYEKFELSDVRINFSWRYSSCEDKEYKAVEAKGKGPSDQ